MTAVCQPHPSVSQNMETRKAGIAMIKNPRFIFAAFLARDASLGLTRYGLYVAAVTSDSHTVMLEIAAPFAVACICFAVCS
jgi:hypothetical protein